MVFPLNKSTTIAITGLLIAWKLYLGAALQLHPDEAYYWLWARHLDWGYFDHAPMIGYLIHATTLFADGEGWVRLSGTLATLAISVWIWRLAVQMFHSTEMASASVLLFNAFPMTALGLLIVTPDVPVFVFWTLSVYLFWQIVQTGQARWWYALGLGAGLALLSKYTAVLLLPCVLLYLLVSEERRWLKTPHPYLALLVTVLVFLPVVYWNSQHEWISFRYQLGHGLKGDGYALERVGEYLAGQAVIVGPLAWGVGLCALAAGLFHKDKAVRWLLCSTLPVLVFFALSSLKKTAAPNWPAFANVGLSVLIAWYLLQQPARWRRVLFSGAFAVSLLISLVITLHARFGVLPLATFSPEAAQADATHALYGWRELTQELENRSAGARLVITPDHQLSAAIRYYSRERLIAVTDHTTRPSSLSQWGWPADQEGRDGLYLWAAGHRTWVSPYEEFFSETALVSPIPVFRPGHATPIRTYNLVIGHRANFAAEPGR